MSKEIGSTGLKELGLVRDLNPGPLAPKARIIPLDQRAVMIDALITFIIIVKDCLYIYTK